MIYLSLSSNNFIESLKSTIGKYIHTKKTDAIIHSFPFVVFSALKNIFKSEQSYIHLDITSEITDILYVSREMIEKTFSFPIGKNHIIRNISKDMNVSFEIAESFFNLFVENTINYDTKEQIEKSINKSLEEWGTLLLNTLSDLKKDNINNKFFITAEKNTASVFKKFLKEKSGQDFTLHINEDTLDHLFLSNKDIYYDEFI